MLYVRGLHYPEEKMNIFKDHQGADDFWVVASYEAKTRLQNEILKKEQTISGRRILRASEFWFHLFSVNCADWKVVSESLIFTLIEEWFNSQDLPPQYKDIELFYNSLEQLLPLIHLPQELLDEWLRSDAMRAQRIGGWLEQVRSFWASLQQKRIISRPWSQVVLQQHYPLQLTQGKNYFFDLGSDLKHQEVDLLIELSRDNDVYLLMPHPEWQVNASKTLAVYQKAVSAGKLQNMDRKRENNKAKIKTRSFVSPLAEVQNAVQQIREWLKGDYQAKQIAVVAPDIEEYWDLIREYFLVEGLAVQKKYVAKAISLPQVQLLLSRLHLKKSQFEQHSLEETLFNSLSQKEKPLSYSEFKQNYFNIYDYKPIKKIFLLEEGIKPAEEIDTLSFLDMLFIAWPQENKDFIDEIADLVIADLSADYKMTYELWVKYLELLLSRQEVTLQDGNAEGIFVGNINELDWKNLQQVIVLGCVQKNLCQSVKTPANIYDVLDIERDLGYYLNRPEKLKNEFDLRWMLEQSAQTYCLYRAETDFEGQPQVASSFWLSLNQNHEDLQKFPTLTRWKYLMDSNLSSMAADLKWSEAEVKLIQDKINLDNHVEPESLKLEYVYSGPLSASSLASLSQCGFKFYADKVLKLEEPHVYDLDIDHLYQGSLLHKCFELLLIEHPNLTVTDHQLELIYEQALKEEKKSGELADFWYSEKARHLRLIKAFINFELELRLTFPQAQIKALEVPFKGYISHKDGVVHLDKQQGENSWLFRGKIDRIDSDDNGFLSLIDYKVTKSKHLKTFQHWAENEQFQLVLYALAIENAMAEPEVPASEVVSAAYYFMKDIRRGSGFIIKDKEHGLANKKNNASRQLISAEGREELFSAVLKKVAESLYKVEASLFAPIPKEKEICDTCDWRSLCRAPHLK